VFNGTPATAMTTDPQWVSLRDPLGHPAGPKTGLAAEAG
jgi:hypothetical protein